MTTINKHYILHLADEDGTILDSIDLFEYNLDKSIAQSDICHTIQYAIEVWEQQQEKKGS
ncbi:hypothetical protein LCGC14_0406210 [marine sediment metagenome]|uniref:Uncharacterized protein n=1 Tax=marine sediment metagenome TaxID=412755 RepID=A0A0F9TDF4_9ZZZZ